MMFVGLLLSTSSFLVPSAPGARLAAQRSDVSMMAGKIPVKNVWVDFAQASDIPPGTVGSGFRYGQELAIANVGGSLYALSNKLPPTGQPATAGVLEKKGNTATIVEPISGSAFDLKTGKPVGDWCPTLVGGLIGLLTGPSNVPVFAVRKSGNKIQCNINVNAKAQFESQYWRGVLDAQGKVDGGYY